jgi:hypothetical protein
MERFEPAAMTGGTTDVNSAVRINTKPNFFPLIGAILKAVRLGYLCAVNSKFNAVDLRFTPRASRQWANTATGPDRKTSWSWSARETIHKPNV